MPLADDPSAGQTAWTVILSVIGTGGAAAVGAWVRGMWLDWRADKDKTRTNEKQDKKDTLEQQGEIIERQAEQMKEADRKAAERDARWEQRLAETDARWEKRLAESDARCEVRLASLSGEIKAVASQNVLLMVEIGRKDGDNRVLQSRNDYLEQVFRDAGVKFHSNAGSGTHEKLP